MKQNKNSNEGIESVLSMPRGQAVKKKARAETSEYNQLAPFSPEDQLLIDFANGFTPNVMRQIANYQIPKQRLH